MTGNSCTGAVGYCRGTGVYLNESDASLQAVVITANEQSWPGSGGLAYGWGAGLYAYDGDPILVDVDVQDNVHYAIARYSLLTAYGVGVFMPMETSR